MNASRIDLDEILSQLPPWNLVLTIGGEDYPVRELRISDLDKLQPATLTNRSELMKFVESLFEGKRPDLNAWSLDILMVVIARIATYARERSERNSRIAAHPVSTANAA